MVTIIWSLYVDDQHNDHIWSDGIFNANTCHKSYTFICPCTTNHFSSNPGQWNNFILLPVAGLFVGWLSQTALLTTLVFLNPWFYRVLKLVNVEVRMCIAGISCTEDVVVDQLDIYWDSMSVLLESFAIIIIIFPVQLERNLVVIK